jgi:hypothetical protein
VRTELVAPQRDARARAHEDDAKARLKVRQQLKALLLLDGCRTLLLK